MLDGSIAYMQKKKRNQRIFMEFNENELKPKTYKKKCATQHLKTRSEKK